MNIEQAKHRVEEIRRSAGDDERAHGMEDSLYSDFIKHVQALGIDGVSDVAAEILKTKDIDFSRWCA